MNSLIPGGPSAGDFFFLRDLLMRNRAVADGDELRHFGDAAALERRHMA
jgi:hypothetical protein